jgi:hypothetical protein
MRFAASQAMAAKFFALLTGFVYLFFGISGLFPRLVHLPTIQIRFYSGELNSNWGFLYSWLPSNTAHAVVYIIIGALGVLSFIAFGLATRYAKALFAITLLFVIAGFLPFGISSLWGFLPLFGWNIMLHTVTAILAYYYGWIYPLDLGGPMVEEEEAAPAGV